MNSKVRKNVRQSNRSEMRNTPRTIPLVSQADLSKALEPLVKSYTVMSETVSKELRGRFSLAHFIGEAMLDELLYQIQMESASQSDGPSIKATVEEKYTRLINTVFKAVENHKNRKDITINTEMGDMGENLQMFPYEALPDEKLNNFIKALNSGKNISLDNLSRDDKIKMLLDELMKVTNKKE